MPKLPVLAPSKREHRPRFVEGQAVAPPARNLGDMDPLQASAANGQMPVNTHTSGGGVGGANDACRVAGSPTAAPWVDMMKLGVD